MTDPLQASHQFSVNSPLEAEEAFNRLADLTRVNEWDEGVTNPHQVAGDGPGLGARYRVTVLGFDGRPTQVEYELTEFSAPDRFVMIGRHPDFEAHDTIVITPAGANADSSSADDAGCTVAYTARLTLLGDQPPLTNEQLDSLFVKIAGVAEAGVSKFLAG